MSIRIPPRVDAAIDWVGAHLAAPVRAHPVAAVAAVVPVLLVAAPLWLPAVVAYVCVGAAGLMAGVGTTHRAYQGRIARANAERDDALREAGRARHEAAQANRRADHLEAQITRDSVPTTRLPTITAPPAPPEAAASDPHS